MVPVSEMILVRCQCSLFVTGNTGVAVALFVSNCQAAGAKGRYQYVEELMKLIPVCSLVFVFIILATHQIHWHCRLIRMGNVSRIGTNLKCLMTLHGHQ
jgi:hypothetical protein